MGRVTEPAEEQPLAPADMSTPLAPADMSNPITFETAVVTIICEGEREDPDSADRKIDVGHLKLRPGDIVKIWNKNLSTQLWTVSLFVERRTGRLAEGVEQHGLCPSVCLFVIPTNPIAKVFGPCNIQECKARQGEVVDGRETGFDVGHAVSAVVTAVAAESATIQDKWHRGPLQTVKVALSELKYDQWSKATFLTSSYVVIGQCVLVLGWRYNETDRIVEGVLVPANREVERYHAAVAVIYLAALLAFFTCDRLWFGTTPVPRCLFTWCSGVSLWVLHPTILGSVCLICVSVLAFGAWKTKEKCQPFSRRLNPIPVVDSIIDKYRDFRAGKNPDHSWGYKEGRTAIEFYTMDPAGKVDEILEAHYVDYKHHLHDADEISISMGEVEVMRATAAACLEATMPVLVKLDFHKMVGKDQEDKAFKLTRAGADVEPGGHRSLGEIYDRLIREDRLGKILTMVVYMAVNTYLYIEAHARTRKTIDDLGLGLSGAAPVAKGMGAVLNFNCSLIAVPVLGAVLRYLHDVRVRKYNRQTGEVQLGRSLDYYIPIGKNITFHRYIAWFTMFAASVHTVAHFINYGKAAEATYAVFPNLDGVWGTGLAIIICQVLMYAAALENVRRACFNAFWFSHHLFVVFWACLLYHGPVFYIWSAFPLITYFASRVYRERAENTRVVVQEVVMLPPDMISLVMKNEGGEGGYDMFEYRPGQYVRINCPFLAPAEWHPFTISSAPESGTLSLHIKITRPDSFTGMLKRYFQDMNPLGHRIIGMYGTKGHRRVRGRWKSQIHGDGSAHYPMIKIDGPHSAPCMHMLEYEHIMMFGAGVGLTPFSSGLSSIVDHQWRRQPKPASIYFYWSFRMGEFSMYRWFVKLLSQVRAVYLSRKLTERDFAQLNLHINLYATRGFQGDEAALVDRTIQETPPQIGYSRDDPKYMKCVLAPDPAKMDENALDIQVGQVCELVGASALDSDISKVVHVLLNGDAGWVAKKCLAACDQIGTLLDESNSPKIIKVAPMHDCVHVKVGRPNYDDIFREIAGNHDGEIGVFCCGPMGKQLREACKKWSQTETPNSRAVIFKLHAEVF